MSVSEDPANATAGRWGQVEFRGDAGDYFRIWIVNMFLTLVTLGIYSAWAKVRRNRYFYSHTRVFDSGFDYHANPIAILKGRLIAVSLLAVFGGVGYLLPGFELLVFLLVFLVSPWLVVQAKRFALGNSSYRGIRFGFIPRLGAAYKAIFGGGIVAALTFGLGIPYAVFLKNRFIANHARYGETQFEYHGGSPDFYQIYGAAFGLFLGGFVLVMVLMFLLIAQLDLSPNPEAPMPVAAAVIVYLPIGLLYLGVFTFVRVRTINHMFNELTIGNQRIRSDLGVIDVFWIYFSNAVVIIVSVGLLIPWASVRMARYRADHTKVLLVDDWDELAAAAAEDASATGEEVGEAFDVDLGF